jgi:hypothetical protein
MLMMDRFRTRIGIPASAVKIGYQTKSLFLGSCFADSIGKIMARYKFPVLLNPFGTLFNPVSIGDNIGHLISGKPFTGADLRFHNNLWLSFSHYTGFTHPDRDTCLSSINQELLPASRWLKTCDFLMLTFGTAWTYRLNETGQIVANCHKLPSSDFTRELADPDKIISHYDAVLLALRQYNPAIRVIFTLSPVRHWSDGAENNQLSKSILHFSIHEIMKRHAETYYFPAYEIFMDELRDYRFYAADMLHPSEQGIEYTWERFSETWLDEPSKKIMAGVAAILKAVGHRPLHTESTNHKKFEQNTLKQIEHLTGLYPFLDFSNEIALLRLHKD